LIELFLGLGIALVFVKQSQLRPWLVLSMVFSVAIWWGVQALGLLFTGMTTDVNSGPLLILMALACWPVVVRSKVGQKYTAPSVEAAKDTVPIESSVLA
jgi:hypothetical protein